MVKNIHVLIIEDSKDQIWALKTGLEQREEVMFTTESALTVESAVARLRRGGVDVVLLDLHLPDGHGSMLIDKVKEAAPDVKVIVLTGWTDDELRKEAEAHGADAYLIKPTPTGELSKQLQWQMIYKSRDEEMDHVRTVLAKIGTEVKNLLNPDSPIPPLS